MAPRNRSLTGCGTCRSRHLKCDETRPGCQLCQVLGIPCPGYASQLQWTRDAQAQLESPPEAKSETRVYRRPLFPTHEQQFMAHATVHSLQGQNATEALENLDIQSGHHNLLPSKCLFQGPFGILNLMSNEASPNDRAELDAYLTGTQKRQGAPISPTLDLTAVTPHFSSTSPPSSTIAGAEEDPSIRSRKDEIHDKNPVSHTWDSYENDCLSSILSNSSLSPATSQFIPEHAKTLLRYFENHVVTLSPFLEDNRLCPWKNIHVPSTKKTFAELLLHETANSLGLSLFYSVLAASCIHLSQRDQESSDWDRLGKHYKNIGMHHLNLSIQQEVATEGQLPYKELLVSLLSMIILEIICGDYTHAQTLLIESECLIRKRGLPKKRKSLKVRTLHHVYTYLRIMAETTCGCAFMHICPERPNASLVSADSAFNSLRSFRLPNNGTGHDLGCDTEKPDEIGYDDIHLELLGVWKNSLFQEMYGVPEILMGLLSQTVRLANEQELLHRDTELDPDIVMTLSRRTKLLEQSILSWKAPEDMVSPQAGSKASLMDTQRANVAYHSATTLHQALVLFYYRRVHNINALMLQDTVRKVIRSAELTEEAAMNNNRNYEASLLWPIFIASCEAVDTDLQKILHEWLLSTGNRTHIPSFAAAAVTAQRVWELRQERQDYTLSWFNAISDDRCPIIVI